MDNEITVLMQFVAKPSEADAFGARLRESALDRSRHPGSLRVTAQRDLNAPWRFTLLEVFESQQAIDAYYATSIHQRWEQRVAPLLVEMTGEDQSVILDWCCVRGLRIPDPGESGS